VTVTGAGGLSLTPTPVYANNTAAGVNTASASYTYGGDANHDGSSDSKNFSINKANTSTVAGSASATFGDTSVSLTATVSNTSNAATVNQGTVHFTIWSNDESTQLADGGTVAIGLTSNFNPSALSAGPYKIHAQYSGGSNFNDSCDCNSGTLTINPKPTVTIASVTPGAVQYSDTVALSATVSPASFNSSTLTGSVTFTIGTWTSAPIAINGSGVASIPSVQILLPANTYAVNAAFTSTNGNFTNSNNSTQPPPSLVVTTETANPVASSGAYTGQRYAWTPTATSNTATLTLGATIIDNTDPLPGDIRTAKVGFGLRDVATGKITPMPSAQNLAVGLVDPSDTTKGTSAVTLQFSLNANEICNVYTIAVLVGGNYNMPTPTWQDTTVSVCRAVPGTILSNPGADISNAGSSGFIAGDNTNISTVAFDVKYNNKATNPQGKVALTVHSNRNSLGAVDGKAHEYHIVSNAISTLNVKGSLADFSAKANVIELVTNPEDSTVTAVSLDGGAIMQLSLDASTQKLGIQVNFSKTKGGMWYANQWDGLKTVNKVINNPGAIVVLGIGSTNTLTIMSSSTSATTPTTAPATATTTASTNTSANVTDNSLVSNLGGMFVTGSNSTVGNASVPSVANSTASPRNEPKSFSGRAQLSNDGSDTSKSFAAEGSLGRNWVSSLFDSSLQFVSSTANAEGAVSITVRSCNKPDGSLDKRCVASKPSTHHVYLLETNALTGATLTSGATSFASKTRVYEVMSNGTKLALDEEGSMQIVFIAKSQMIPLDAGAAGGTTCMDDSGCVAIAAQKSAGGIWYSGAWGLSSGLQGEAAANTR
jgi:hypothetical protein